MIKLKIIVTVLLISMLMFNVLAAHTVSTNLEKHNESLTLSFFDLAVYVVDIDAGDVWNTYATPGQEITVNFAICNWESTSDYYYGQMYVIDSVGNGELVWESPSNINIAPGTCAPDYFFSFNAPTTPGTYKVEANSFKVSDWSLDDTSYFWLHVESTGTPTSTPTGTPTATPTGTPPPVNIPPIPSVTKTITGNVYSYDASASTDPDGTIVSYSWTVDDVVAGTGQTFELDGSTFSSGIHTTKLVITDNSGAASTYTHTITVSVEDETVIIESGDESTIEGDTEVSPLTTEQGDALFVMNVGGQPFYIPGFSAIFAIAGLLAVAYLFYRKRHD